MRSQVIPVLLGVFFCGPTWSVQPLGCLIVPSRVAEVGSPVVGVIDTLLVERGDTVRKGQKIAQLKSDVERAALEVAESKAISESGVKAAAADRDLARHALTRAEKISKDKFISEHGLDQARTQVDVTQQKYNQAVEQKHTWERELRLAKAQLAQREIRSPIDGVVVERYLSVGERVEEKPLFKVAKIDPLQVEVVVPAAMFGLVRTGSTVSVIPELPSIAALPAKVSLVDKLIDGASNTFRVRLELPNPDQTVPAGVRCQADLGDANKLGSDSRGSPPEARQDGIKPASGTETVSHYSPARTP